MQATKLILVQVFICYIFSGARGCAQVRVDNQSPTEADGTVRVCAEFTEATEQAGTLTIATSTLSNGATAPEDYIGLIETVTIPMGNTADSCVTIQINTDDEVEDIESFRITLTSNTIPICPQDPVEASINIQDSTILQLVFDESVISQPEQSDVVDVCFRVGTGIVVDRVVNYQLSIVPGGTASILDFIIINNNLQVTPSNFQNLVCAPVTIMNDVIVESDEFLLVTITSSDEEVALDVTGGPVQVTIIDNDGAELTLEPSSATLNEGNTGMTAVPFCVNLDTTTVLARDVNLILNTDSITATPGNDYQEIVNQILTIPAGSRSPFQVCSEVEVIGDFVIEADEVFEVILTREDSDDTISDPSFRVTIISEGMDFLVECMALPDPLNGSVETTTNLENGIATYSCITGFFLVGSDTRVCQPSATWSGNAPTCQIEDCGDLEDPANGMVEDEPSTFDSVAVYRCDPGFELDSGNDTFTRICQADGTWSLMAPTCNAVDCGSLDTPVNGTLVLFTTTFNSVATYTCDFGFLLSTGGSAFTRRCAEDAMWTGTDPSCDIADCGDLEPPEMGNVSLTGTTFQSTATYTCNEGHDLVGTAVRVCGADAMWTAEAPICEPVDCGELSDPLNGQVTHPTTTFGSMATYSCDAGFFLSGSSFRICTANGTWSDEEPTCTIIDCGDLLPSLNGAVDDSDTTENAVAVYTCEPGFNLTTAEGVVLSQPTFTRTCQSNATWSGMAPTCTPEDCGLLPDIANGNLSYISVGVTTVGSVAVYSCSDGLTLLGNVERVCSTDVEWTGSDPTCEDFIPVISSSTDESVSAGTDVTFNCTVPGVPEELVSSLTIIWSIEGVELSRINETNFLELDLSSVTTSDAGNYTCIVLIVTDVLAMSLSNTTSVFSLSVTGGSDSGALEPSSSNTLLIVGVTVGGGLGLLVLIGGISIIVLCLLCAQKKKNYEKYVLPYRAYVHANKTANSTITDVPIWQNTRAPKSDPLDN